jgi:hypothetical protein
MPVISCSADGSSWAGASAGRLGQSTAAPRFCAAHAWLRDHRFIRHDITLHALRQAARPVVVREDAC